MNKQNLLSLFLILFCCNFAFSQNTMSALTSGGSTENGLYVVVGQLFSGESETNGSTVLMGIAQAQLQEKSITDNACYGEDYNKDGFLFPAGTAVGEYEQRHYSHNAQYNYDSVTTLTLTVNPTYEISRDLTFYGELQGDYHEGSNDVYLQSQFGCDSILHINVTLLPFTCGDNVIDIDGNEYPTVSVANYCWTQKNISATHYSNDGSDIAKALVYKSSIYSDESENESIYGRLYTWYSAVRVSENSSEQPNADANGYVQGICPNGWHIPTSTEFAALQSFPAVDLRSTEYWLTPNNNTNSTGFSALPAGLFNAASQRFEKLLGYTAFWSIDKVSTSMAKALQMTYSCDEATFENLSASDAVSVRCVKN